MSGGGSGLAVAAAPTMLLGRLQEARTLLALRPYRLLFTARVLSLTGTAVAPIALAFAVLQLNGRPDRQAGSLGLVLAAGMLPRIALLPVGGVVADRFRRDRVLVATNLTCALAEAVTVVLLVTGAARLWHLAAMSLLCGTAAAFAMPASESLVAHSVPDSLRYPATVLLMAAQNSVKVGGPALGGVLIAVAGSTWLIAWDALTFIASAVLLARIGSAPASSRRPRTAGALPGREPAGLIRFLVDLGEGWIDLRSRPWLCLLVAHAAFVAPIWMVGYQLMGPLYSARHLGGAGPWGKAMAAFAVGLLAGAAAAFVMRPHRVWPVVCASTAAQALPLGAMALRWPVPALIGATALAGVGTALYAALWGPLLQQELPPDRLSRAVANSAIAQLLPIPAAYLLAGPATHLFGPRTVMAAGALALTLAAVLPPFARRIRTLTLIPSRPGKAAGRTPRQTA
ncbi:MFS transporter [Actinomadura macrotermitis]|uniref:MFS transporter n=1 Tax=Actinomadura macrotermitis TaxID=2585200 RepID=UPI001A9BD1C3|nr:MFS transporter [Actinomadura macrotermitis]